MRRTVLFFIFLILSVALAYGHTDVTVSEVKAMIEAGGPLTIVDVREESEYCDSTYSPPGHIPGAVNMPWYSEYFQAHYEELPTDEDIVIVCRSGNRSNQAADFLDSAGFTRVFDMLGGMNAWTYETELCGLASVAEPGGTTPILALEPARPSPFGGTAEIFYSIPRGDVPVRLDIYDTRGRLVKTLADEAKPAGTYSALWHGTDGHGRPVSSGVYFYRLSRNGESKTRRVVLTR